MKIAPWIIIIILIGIIFLQRECGPSSITNQNSVTTIDTIFDTIEYTNTVYTPLPIYRDTGSTKWKTLTVDTIQILRDYFATISYVDTLQSDTNALIIVTDTISQNRIVNRQSKVTIFPHIIHTKTVLKQAFLPTRQIFLGFVIGSNPKQLSFSPSMVYISKKQTAYSFSYDILSGDMFFGLYWKIKW
jgi:hypothetical protein